MSQFYFAYGSNMDEMQMQFRCPTSTLIGPGILRNHFFLINSRGVASVAPADGHDVYGLIWKVSEEDECALDRYEGVARGYYVKREFSVVQADGSAATTLVYVASENEPGKSRLGYIDKICRAASDHAFPQGYVEELKTWQPTSNEST